MADFIKSRRSQTVTGIGLGLCITLALALFGIKPALLRSDIRSGDHVTIHCQDVGVYGATDEEAIAAPTDADTTRRLMGEGRLVTFHKGQELIVVDVRDGYCVVRDPEWDGGRTAMVLTKYLAR